MRTNEKAGRRVGGEQGVSAPPLSSCLPSPRLLFFVLFFFVTAFLGICQGFWGLRGGKSSFSGGGGGGSTKQMTFKLDLRGKAEEELSRLGKQHVQRLRRLPISRVLGKTSHKRVKYLVGAGRIFT